jgi:hypothetical protein
LSTILEVDEINNDKGSQLSFVEFLESVVRIAEKCSPAPFGLSNVYQKIFNYLKE